MSQSRHSRALSPLMTSGLAAALLFTGCASPQRPPVLAQATQQLNAYETAELETVQPRLLREARTYEREARAAFERGEVERARLNAHLSIQRYKTAQALAGRDAALALTGAMSEATEGLSEERARLDRERQALAQYDALDDKFGNLQRELESVEASQRDAAAGAQRALLNARSRQAEAIGRGAPSEAPQPYAEGRASLDAALDAFDQRLYDASSEQAAQAISAFDRAIAAAAESDVALRREETLQREQAAQRQDARPPDGGAPSRADDAQLTRARDAIDEATRAQSAAIAARMPEQQRPRYDQATFLLQTAERRLEARDLDEARFKATQARDLFMQGAAQPAQAAGASSQDQARAAIQRAEDARAKIIGTTRPDDPALTRADYALQLARQAADNQDSERAIEKAAEASASYSLLSQRADATPSQAQPAPLATSSSTAPQTSLARAAEEQLVNLKIAQAEALGRMVQERCPGPWREVEALTALAEERAKVGDNARAFELTVRASERLRRCEQGELGAPRASAQPTAVDREAAARADRTRQEQARARAAAGVALQRAQLAYATASADKPGDPGLREPASLIAFAEQWFKEGAYEQTVQLADEARQKLDALMKPKPDAQASQAAQTSPRQTQQAQTTASAAPVAAATGTSPEQCGAAREVLASAEGARERASRAKLAGRVADRFDRAVALQSRARDMIGRQLCEDARPIAAQARDTFEDVLADARDEETRATQQATKAQQPATPQARVAGPDESVWRPAYSKAIDALRARDRAKRVVGAPEQALMDSGEANVQRAQRAWQEGDYFAAAKFSDLAKEDFDGAASAAAARDGEAKAELERANAEAKAQAAKVREAQEAQAAKAAQQASQAQASEKEQLRSRAEDAVRAADLLAKQCADEDCEARDRDRTLAGRAQIKDARAALQQDRLERALQLANAAQADLEAARSTPRPFFINTEASRVSRVGDQLRLDPKIAFLTGGANFTPDTQGTLDQLAMVLKDNKNWIEAITLTGYTDSRGKPEMNKQLSQERAEAVRQALIQRGVAESILRVEGKGAESPIADNRTAAGRELNRRVEVNLTLRAQEQN